MAQRQTQDYLSSGEITEIKIGDSRVITESDSSYCSFGNITELPLTNSFVKITTMSPFISPANVSHIAGTFTVTNSEPEVWHFSFERVYRNEDTAPSNPVRLYLQMKMNGVVAFSRDVIIGAATAADEPSTVAFNTARIISVSNGDQFEFEVKAAEETTNVTPSDTALTHFEVTATKIGY